MLPAKASGEMSILDLPNAVETHLAVEGYLVRSQMIPPCPGIRALSLRLVTIRSGGEVLLPAQPNVVRKEGVARPASRYRDVAGKTRPAGSRQNAGSRRLTMPQERVALRLEPTAFQELDEDVAVWMRRLKDACEAGYYRTESALEEQTPIPWRRATCSDCFAWTDGFCEVYAIWSAASHDTCVYFPGSIQRTEHRQEHEAQSQEHRWWKRLLSRGWREGA